MLTREKLEQIERETLAPYAMKSGDSRGRRYPEEEHPYRTAFQRDRESIIHTTAFRRLKYKTQVFVYYEGDYYRTRLSHTIEAAQVARAIARALMANEDLVEAIALAHDLGHPPFGHAGEYALRDLMKDFGGFEHNMQSLRIVDELEERQATFKGLNLTWEVREGIVKHVTRYDKADASGFEPEKSPYVEAQIVTAADVIAYRNHDLDDGLRGGFITREDLEKAQISLWEDAIQAIGSDRAKVNWVRRRIISFLINQQATDLIYETDRRLRDLRIQSVADVREQHAPVVAFSPEMQRKDKELGDFLHDQLYSHYRVFRMQEKARRCIYDLFGTYLNKPRQLPTWAQKRLKAEELPRVICDYIAGMTDRFALEEHRKLFDPEART